MTLVKGQINYTISVYNESIYLVLMGSLIK